MVFKRRDRKGVWQTALGWLWPRTGWKRAFFYLRHRVSRLPDPPHRIARGVAAGVFVCFTPLFGLHFAAAALLTYIMRGNLIAALLATFFGNPLTFPIIAVTSSQLGHWMLGRHFGDRQAMSIISNFMAAGHDLKHNFIAIFTDAHTQWGALARFFQDVFLPYLVGGIIPGVIAGLLAYYLTLPLISAYQHRRRLRIKDRLDALKAKLAAKRDERHDQQ